MLTRGHSGSGLTTKLICEAPVAPSNVVEIYPERANLYPIVVDPWPTQLYRRNSDKEEDRHETYRLAWEEGAVEVPRQDHTLAWALRDLIITGLQDSPFIVDLNRTTPVIIDKGGVYKEFKYRDFNAIRLLPSYSIGVMHFGGQYYLCLDHRIRRHARISVASLRSHSKKFCPFPGQRVHWRSLEEREWFEARFVKLIDDREECLLELSDGTKMVAELENVVPDLNQAQVLHMAPMLRVTANALERTIKQFSFLLGDHAPDARLRACTDFAAKLGEQFFPIRDGDFVIDLIPQPATLRSPSFSFGSDLNEPSVCFDRVDRTKSCLDIAQGLTSIGTYEKAMSPIRLVVVTTDSDFQGMERLVDRLNLGSLKYQGAAKTFGAEFKIAHTVACAKVEHYDDAVREYAQTQAADDADVALVYLPEVGDLGNPRHPYYRIKGALIREGIAPQMVGEATVANPDYRDMNLGLNLFAKAGYIPWVLDEALSGVDLFIGMSWTNYVKDGQLVRRLAFLNVFDKHGRWRFFRGDVVAVPFERRVEHFQRLVKDSVNSFRRENGGDLRTVCFHYTKRFSDIERTTLIQAVRDVSPGTRVIFVSIDATQMLRMYSRSDDHTSAIQRSSYLYEEPRLLYLATTGGNVFGQRGMGTPVLLRLLVWTDPEDEQPALTEIAQQVLSLTRLNWGSSRNFCHEPITTKFAGQIAHRVGRLMEDPDFHIHTRLSAVPWFL